MKSTLFFAVLKLGRAKKSNCINDERETVVWESVVIEKNDRSQRENKRTNGFGQASTENSWTDAVRLEIMALNRRLLLTCLLQSFFARVGGGAGMAAIFW